MKKYNKKLIATGILFIAVFLLWTLLVQTTDVQPAGINGTDVGFSAFNICVHEFTGENMELYRLTDWLSIVPVAICLFFASIGFVQTVKRKSIMKTDADILLLGVYYITVIAVYLIFEKYPVNYRPVLIDGIAEASYPSSTTMLVICVMSAFVFQLKKRLKKGKFQNIAITAAILFSVFMVIARLVSGVHWVTDIIGAVFISTGLCCIYIGVADGRQTGGK